ncbi:MAG: asparagine synthase (glutamine-hydrolyzing), partial [Bacilli bacterium]
MCGIAGIVSYEKNLTSEIENIEKMTRTLVHRGPDDENIWCDRFVAFGHRRLVVVDPQGGVQPMERTFDGRTYTMIYNGELYNTEDIRQELVAKGFQFSGHSDTEVLLCSYIAWGEICVHRLNGIFSFAIWEHDTKKMFAARDRLGVKPFFYTQTEDSFLFASEIKALLAHPDVSTLANKETFRELLALGPSHTPGSGLFKNIRELRPGHCLRIVPDEKLHVYRYWNVASRIHTDSLEETIQTVRTLLIDSITRQLVSDVPLCTFLSGGVDSSAITAISAERYTHDKLGKLGTYSIDYANNDRYFKASEFQPNSDGFYIDLMRNSFETDHRWCVIENDELLGLLENAVLMRDMPGMADIDSSLLWFCQEIKKDYTVGLSGECADEIFGGYPWFYRAQDLSRDGFPWMRSLESRNSLLRPEWQQQLQLESYMKRRYN